MTCHRYVRAPVWRVGNGEELQPPEQDQEAQQNNEKLPQNANDRQLGLAQTPRGGALRVVRLRQMEMERS